MKFTDRFIEVPIKIYGNKITDNSLMKFDPYEILCYYISSFEGADERETVTIVLKGGDKTCVPLTMTEFESLLNKHQQ